MTFAPRLVPSTILVIPSKGALLLILHDFTEALKPKSLSMWMSWRYHSCALRCCIIKIMSLCHAGRSMGQGRGGFQAKFSLSAQKNEICAKLQWYSDAGKVPYPAKCCSLETVYRLYWQAGNVFVKVLHTEHWHAMWLCDAKALVYSSWYF